MWIALFQKKLKDVKIDRYISYIQFVIKYIQKTEYLGMMIIMFSITFLLESSNRYIEFQLFKMDDLKTDHTYFYIVSYSIISICINFYNSFKKDVESKNEMKLEIVFEKDVFMQKAKIPFHLRQTIDMEKLNELKDSVCQDLKVMIDTFLDFYMNIVIQMILASYVFYENKMLNIFFMICICIIFFMKYITYPLTKGGEQIRENKMKEIRQNRNEIHLLEFHFQPFVENAFYFEKICDKMTQNCQIDHDLHMIYKKPTQLFDYFVNIMIFYVLTKNYMQDLRNYYILFSTLKSLFNAVRMMISVYFQMEECIDHHIEFMSYFKNSIDEDENCVEKMSFPLHIDIHLHIYDGYVLHGNVQIKKNDKIFVTGSSGSGKSTLAKKIAGYDYYKDEEIYRKCVYYLTQDFQLTWSNSNYMWKDLFPNMAIQEIKEYLTHYVFPIHKIKDSDDIFSEIPILSGGEKKRLQYAYLLHRDITEKHEIIIFDELNMSLDQMTTEKLILSLQQFFHSKSLIVIQHEKPSSKEFSSWKEWKVHSDGFISSL